MTWKNLISLLNRLIMKRSRVSNAEVKSSIEDIDREIRLKQENLEMFHSIVGESPLSQIDWVIENGFQEFNKWYKSYEAGTIKRLKLEEDREKWDDYIPQEGDIILRGGIGDRIIKVWKGS